VRHCNYNQQEFFQRLLFNFVFVKTCVPQIPFQRPTLFMTKIKLSICLFLKRHTAAKSETHIKTVTFTRPEMSDSLLIYVYSVICMRRDKICVVASGDGKSAAAFYLYCAWRHPTQGHLLPSGTALFPRYYHINIFSRAKFNRLAARNKQENIQCRKTKNQAGSYRVHWRVRHNWVFTFISSTGPLCQESIVNRTKYSFPSL
jgi:hypothetical protein